MYRTILFGTDGSETADIARQAAIELAMRYDARIVAATANEAVRKPFELGLVQRAAVVLVRGGDPSVGTIRMETVARGRPDRVQVEFRTLQGDPSEQICDLAEREDADLIVVGNKGMA